ncbi:MAG TPA: 2-oxo acid dehydrogenase subunit E2 [Candidatus Limnocylindrales bacterium]|nr:2-oxo acid dehydrogenase subunit E2 [Candidatus Limnocylindrales bacterium]
MSRDLVLPKLGENIDTAVVVEVLVKAGDAVSVDQPLLSLETDKAEFELPSTVQGTVAEILVKEGDEVKMGQALLRVDEGGDGAGKAAPAAAAAQPEHAPASAAERPASARTAPVQPSAARARSEDEEETQAEGAAESAEAPPAAPDSQRASGSGAGRSASEPSARPEREQNDLPPPRAAQAARAPAPPPAAAGPVAAAPSVRRLARELGVDITRVPGSGAGGRISERDVQRHARALLRTDQAATPPGAAEDGEAPGERDAFGAVEYEPIDRIRRRIADRMTAGWTTIPHVTHNDGADVTELERLREQYGSRAAHGGGKLTVTAILLKTLGSALRKFPKLNASLDLDGGRIVYHRYVNVAVAVDTDRGLVAPIIRNVDEKNIMQIARALGEIAERARGRALTPELLEGATFTLSNLGGIGGTHFSPIISPPQVAVLGVGRSQVEPRWVVDRFEPRRILPLSLSYDHRLIDGADAARFVRWVCEALEEPFVMDLEGN